MSGQLSLILCHHTNSFHQDTCFSKMNSLKLFPLVFLLSTCSRHRLRILYTFHGIYLGNKLHEFYRNSTQSFAMFRHPLFCNHNPIVSSKTLDSLSAKCNISADLFKHLPSRLRDKPYQPNIHLRSIYFQVHKSSYCQISNLCHISRYPSCL